MSEQTLEKAPLGKEVNYPVELDRTLLFPVERQAKNDYGYDLWSCYELSCLDKDKKPKQYWLNFEVPANSPNLVESKSLKLYLGSFCKTVFDSKKDIEQEIKLALKNIVGTEISSLRLDKPPYESNTPAHELLDLPKSIDQQINKSKSNKLEFIDSNIEEILSFNSFRALCPVTNQPDHSSIVFSYSGKEIEKASLANYFYSKCDQKGFHENWAEVFYSELTEHTQIVSFSLALFFSRRGGISISPIRQSPSYSGLDLKTYFNTFKLLR